MISNYAGIAFYSIRSTNRGARQTNVTSFAHDASESSETYETHVNHMSQKRFQHFDMFQFSPGNPFSPIGPRSPLNMIRQHYYLYFWLIEIESADSASYLNHPSLQHLQRSSSEVVQPYFLLGLCRQHHRVHPLVH